MGETQAGTVLLDGLFVATFPSLLDGLFGLLHAGRLSVPYTVEGKWIGVVGAIQNCRAS